jgi:hypothetical protein
MVNRSCPSSRCNAGSQIPFGIAVTENVEQDTGDITGHVSYTTYGLANTLRASSSRRRLVSWA